MKPRIVLSVFAVLLMTACIASDDTPAPTSTAAALETVVPPAPHIFPCGLWIADDEAAAIARYTAGKTNPDMVQITLPGGLSCAAIIAAASAVEANRGAPSSAIVMPIVAPGAVAINLPWDNGIGTSPSDPLPDAFSKAARNSSQLVDESSPPADDQLVIDETTDPGSDLKVVCTRYETLPCGYVLGRVLYCRMCVCEELEGCHGDPMCASCAEGF